MKYRWNAVWAGAAVVLSGCAGSPTNPGPTAARSGIDPKTHAEGDDSFATQMRDLLNSSSDQTLAKPGERLAASIGRSRSDRAAAPQPPSGSDPQAPDGAQGPAKSVSPQATDAAESAAERKARLAAELSQAIRSDPHGADLLREALPFLALDMIEPGIADPDLAAIEKSLSPVESRAFDNLRRAMRELRRGNGAEGTPAGALDAGEIARILRDHGAELDTGQTITIPTIALCTSVKSYGRYTAFQSRTFTQGRTHQAILYAAVDHFSQREVDAEGSLDAKTEKGRESAHSSLHSTGGSTAIRGLRAALTAAFDSGSRPKPADQDEGVDFALELEQTVELFHDSDNIVVWKVPARVIRDVSHQRLRDCYLAQIIELPANLSTGKFNLKVTVRDLHSGGLAESVLPLEIVADSPYAQANP
jgi:hypothetical protein